MRAAIIGLLVLMSAYPGLAASAPVPASLSFVRPEWSLFMMPEAVDHTAVMAFHRAWGRVHDDKATIYRSGVWQREDIVENGHAFTTIANLATGISWQVSRGPDGKYLSLIISGSQAPLHNSIEKTADTDQALGETCTVWRFTHGDVIEKDCLTADGLMLWQKISSPSGTDFGSAHALSIKRRPVSPAEVRPPADLLALRSWGDWTTGMAKVPNDEVLLQNAVPPGDMVRETLQVRRLGALSFRETNTLGQRTRIYDNGRFQLTVTDGWTQAQMRLEIAPVSTPKNVSVRRVLVKPTVALTILGETCRTFDMAPGVSDYGQTECRTPDGVLLQQTITRRGDVLTLQATRLSRGKLEASNVMPPANLLQIYGAGTQPLLAQPVAFQWQIYPNMADQSAYYPAKAHADEIEGYATLLCHMADNGAVKACSILSESPKGYGFGQATVTLLQKFAKAKAGTFQPGQEKRITHRWDLD